MTGDVTDWAWCAIPSRSWSPATAWHDCGDCESPIPVIHGVDDVMCDVSGGRAAAVAVLDAKLAVIDGMRHSCPDNYGPRSTLTSSSSFTAPERSLPDQTPAAYASVHRLHVCGCPLSCRRGGGPKHPTGWPKSPDPAPMTSTDASATL